MKKELVAKCCGKTLCSMASVAQNRETVRKRGPICGKTYRVIFDFGNGSIKKEID